jgi:hypothetical protein
MLETFAPSKPGGRTLFITAQEPTLDRIFTVSQTNPKAFHRLWIEPLLAAGLSLEAALGHIIVSYFKPN